MKQSKSLWILSASVLAFSATVLTGCKPNVDDYMKKPFPTDQERITHAEKTLGVSLDLQSDWSLSKQYSVTINADADLDNIYEVVVLDGNPLVKPSHRLARQSLTNGGSTSLSFRAGKGDEVLYAVCISQDGHCMARPFHPGQDQTVSFIDVPTASKAAASAASRRAMTIISPPDRGTFFMKDFPSFRDAVLKILPQGKDNRSVIGGGDLSNVIKVKRNPYSIYDLPLAFMYGEGSDNDNICYNWYPDGSMTGEPFLIKDSYSASKDIPIYDGNRKQWAMNGYYLQCMVGGSPDAVFAPGDILKFQLANGEEVIDDTESPRVKVFMLNGYVIFACEDGNNWDYRDRLFWMPEGAERIEKSTVIPVDPEPIEPQVWTYAWEDKDFGDYDMNDCVIEVQENAEDHTKLDIKLVALGGRRHLWLGYENKNAKSYRDYTAVFPRELHEMLGIKVGEMANTGNGTKDVEPATITLAKPAGFDFQTCSFVLGCKHSDEQGVYENDYYFVSIAAKGQEPHGIVIPGKWQWPTEQTCIVKAYPDFKKWAGDRTQCQDWYKRPAEGEVVNR